MAPGAIHPRQRTEGRRANCIAPPENTGVSRAFRSQDEPVAAGLYDILGGGDRGSRASTMSTRVTCVLRRTPSLALDTRLGPASEPCQTIYISIVKRRGAGVFRFVRRPCRQAQMR